jgi:hypothetical protein
LKRPARPARPAGRPVTRYAVPPAIAAGGFPAEIRSRALAIRDGSQLGAFLASELDRLADLAAFLGASSPLDLVHRREVEEDNLRTHWYDLGRDHGREDR